MLMRVTETVDYNHIKPEHEAIHARLVNWARWLRPRLSGWHTHPMWKGAITSRQWDISPHIPIPLKPLEAMEVEKAVAALPENPRAAVRWWYVYRRDPVAMARNLGVSKQGLAELVEAGRTMLQNRL